MPSPKKAPRRSSASRMKRTNGVSVHPPSRQNLRHLRHLRRRRPRDTRRSPPCLRAPPRGAASASPRANPRGAWFRFRRGAPPPRASPPRRAPPPCARPPRRRTPRTRAPPPLPPLSEPRRARDAGVRVRGAHRASRPRVGRFFLANRRRMDDGLDDGLLARECDSSFPSPRAGWL